MTMAAPTSPANRCQPRGAKELAPLDVARLQRSGTAGGVVACWRRHHSLVAAPHGGAAVSSGSALR